MDSESTLNEKKEKRMKRGKILFVFLCLLAVLFPSCNGDNTSPEAKGGINVRINNSIKNSIGGGKSRQEA